MNSVDKKDKTSSDDTIYNSKAWLSIYDYNKKTEQVRLKTNNNYSSNGF